MLIACMHLHFVFLRWLQFISTIHEAQMPCVYIIFCLHDKETIHCIDKYSHKCRCCASCMTSTTQQAVLTITELATIVTFTLTPSVHLCTLVLSVSMDQMALPVYQVPEDDQVHQECL